MSSWPFYSVRAEESFYGKERLKLLPFIIFVLKKVNTENSQQEG